MSVEEVTMYRVICDRCGQPDDSDDYYAWCEAEQALMAAGESEWLITDAGQWCNGCTGWDEEADELVPLATTPSTDE